MIAIILCGGKGVRLMPITADIPKSLVPIQGKPVIEHILDLFRKYGMRDIILSTGHLKEKIKEHFSKQSLGLNISYLEEDTPLGTAGPLILMKRAGTFPKSTFILCNGDELKDIDIEKMIEFHKKNKALVTIALTEAEDPSSYGVANLEADKILEFVEKPKKEDAPSNFINSGFYIMEPGVINFIPDGFAMLEKDVFPKIAKIRRLFGFTFNGQWFPTDNMERLQKAEREWEGIK